MSMNQIGGAYALTVFTPILPGREQDVRTTIESVPRGPESPLARLPQLHTSRLQVFDQLVYGAAPQKPDQLKSRYLVFTAVFDGELGAFLRAITEFLPVEADSWWRHCFGYPGLADPAAFERWIRHNQMNTTGFMVASPNATVARVRESLALRERVLEFAIGTQGLEAGELQKRFRQSFVDGA